MSYDDLPDAVVVSDPDGTILEANSMARDLLFGGTDPVGLPRSKVLPLITDAGDDWWACLKGPLALGTISRQPERLLHLAAVEGRPEVPVTVTMRWSDGNTFTVLRSARARLSAERSGAELISTVAHELRSPLTSVKGFTATLLQKWDRFNDDQKKLMLQTVNSDADRVTRLLGDLLDVSRLDSGRMELRKQVVDVRAKVIKAVDGRLAAGEAPEGFDLALEPHDEVWADPDKVEQIVGNLIENAVRHGDGTVHVVLHPGVHGGVRLEVHDEGTGVPPELVSRIFTKFWRDKSKRGGTGLGLYIVKGLAEAHGGRVEVGTSPHGGALFAVMLPAGIAPYDEPDANGLGPDV